MGVFVCGPFAVWRLVYFPQSQRRNGGCPVNQELLSAKNLGKAFRQYGSEWHRIFSWFGVPARSAGEHWVLRNISFDVGWGEAVGIVGQNGAGKSTLLKLIVGTQKPTEGTVETRGRVAAILELGMGFNPELSGRQNVFHSAGVMGFLRREIERVMPEIEEFADIGDYFDQPVRTYSSGMQMRVAFGVATAIRPEILVVDEALAVGDAAFQRKCFQRIESYISAGTTLLYVSHDIEGVKKVCHRAIFLKHGRLEAIGAAKDVCDEYEKYLFGGRTAVRDVQRRSVNEGRSARYDDSLKSDCEKSYGDGRAVIERIWLENEAGFTANVFYGKELIRIKFLVRFIEAVSSPVFAFLIKIREGIAVYGTDTGLLKQKVQNFSSGDLVEVAFTVKNVLSPGIYYLNCGIRDDAGKKPVFLHRRVDALLFKVVQDAPTAPGIGLANLEASVQIHAEHGSLDRETTRLRI
jgi:lipopolysaccharide transport system ATP-binding protein